MRRSSVVVVVLLLVLLPATGIAEPWLDHLQHARKLMAEGHDKAALDVLDQALRNTLEAGHAPRLLALLLVQKALILVRLGQLEAAGKTFQAALRLNPQDQLAAEWIRVLSRTARIEKDVLREPAEESPSVQKGRQPSPPLEVPLTGPVRGQIAWLTETEQGRGTLQGWLHRAEKYLPAAQYIFRSMGLPEDLALVMLPESGANPYAGSHAGARGAYQIMPGTGAELKLIVEHPALDERRSVEKAALAAAVYLKEQHQRFGNWSLALAAYNCGPGCVEKRIRRQETTNVWELNLPQETRTYVPRVYAVIYVFRHLAHFGFHFTPAPEAFEVVEIQGPGALSQVAQQLGVEMEMLRQLNPELKGLAIPTGPYRLKIPVVPGQRRR